MYYKHLKGVLTNADCQSIIARGETQGFEAARVNQGNGTQALMTRVRNNERVLFDDPALALALQAKLQAMGDFPYGFGGLRFHKTGTLFRIYKYTPGQYFKPHKDGSVEEAGCRSETTVLFYLNETDGGETILMPQGKGQQASFIRIAPKPGDVLLFEHGFWHEGLAVNSGEKHVLRTDLFYAPA